MNVQHIETEASDHSSLMLSSDVEPIRKIKQFYFDRRWIESEGVQNIISKAWSYDCNGFEKSQVSFKIIHICRTLERIIDMKGNITALRNNTSNF